MKEILSDQTNRYLHAEVLYIHIVICSCKAKLEAIRSRRLQSTVLYACSLPQYIGFSQLCEHCTAVWCIRRKSTDILSRALAYNKPTILGCCIYVHIICSKLSRPDLVVYLNEKKRKKGERNLFCFVFFFPVQPSKNTSKAKLWTNNLHGWCTLAAAAAATIDTTIYTTRLFSEKMLRV